MNQFESLESEHNVTIIYLTKSGSTLYGTSSPTSDIDYHGIFLPAKSDLLLGSYHQHITNSTGSNKAANTSDDTDITLWSVQKFFNLLLKGETGAIDLLFSMFATHQVTTTPLSDTIRDNYKSFLSSNPSAFVGYAIGQATRYGLKSARHKELVAFHKFLGSLIHSESLYDNHSAVGKELTDGGYVHISIDDQYLTIGDKQHDITLESSVIYDRVGIIISKAGNRTVSNLSGEDWKSLSNALRVALQVEELLTTGFITFPLAKANLLRDIKLGKIPKQVVLDNIQFVVNSVEQLQLLTKLSPECDRSLANKLILDAYRD